MAAGTLTRAANAGHKVETVFSFSRRSGGLYKCDQVLIYVIDGAASVLVADGTVINPAMPVYQFTAASFAAPTGSDLAAALSLWLPPLFTENPLNGTLTQRADKSFPNG